MKRKGFTLVELLAVIAILAILVIIALPNVIKLFNDAKKNTFLTEVKSLYNQASSKYISESLKGNKLGEINSSDSSKLDITGDLIYKIKLDNNGKVVSVAVKKGNYCISTTKDSSKITKGDVKEDCEGFSVLANWYDECKDKNTLRCKMLSDNKTYDDSVKSEFVSSTSGINFKEISSDTNGKGLYYSTNQDVTDENNDGLTNRIYYYRGNIKNNFVVLGDKCYKILRTTENGNVKLMYHDNANEDGTCNEKVKYKESTELLGGQVENQVRFNYGSADSIYSGYMYGDVKLKEDFFVNVPLLLTFIEDFRSLPVKYSKSYEYKDGAFILTGDVQQGQLDELCNKNSCSLKGNYVLFPEYNSSETNNTKLCYINSYDSVKYYTNRNFDISNDNYVSDSYKYENGKFSLSGNIMTSIEAQSKKYCESRTCYTLNSKSKDSKIYKIKAFAASAINNHSRIYVDTLKYGAKNNSELLNNKNDSAMKKMLDAWYEININNKNLTTKIADEIYCNDRSQLTIDKDSFVNDYVKKQMNSFEDISDEFKNTIKKYGYKTTEEFLREVGDAVEYNFNGLGNYAEDNKDFSEHYVGFSAAYRFFDNEFEKFFKYIKDSGKTTYKCKNKTDRFTTSTLGNGKLKYPIATITADEVMYAGASPKGSNKNYFLANNGSFWTMTPLVYNADVGGGMYVIAVRDDGMIENLLVDDASVNMDDGLVRRGKPVISLKSDMETTKGNGTVSNPYVIK